MNHDKVIELYQAITAGNEERVFEHWHASSIATCPKAHYMHRLGIGTYNPPTAGKVLRWGAGHLLEASIREHIETVYGELKSNERLTSLKYDLTGEYDNLVVKDSRLVEVKSVHDYAFIERDGKAYLKEETGGTGPRGGKEYAPKKAPYLHHQWQQHAYVLLLEEQGVTVTDIDYVYISLSGRLCVYSTKVDPDILEAVKQRLRVLYGAWQTKTPPPCECHPSKPFWNEANRWCDYAREGSYCCEIPEKY